MLLTLATYGFVGLSWALVYLRLWRRAQRRVIPPGHPLLALQDPAPVMPHRPRPDAAPDPARITRLRLVPKGQAAPNRRRVSRPVQSISGSRLSRLFLASP